MRLLLSPSLTSQKKTLTLTLTRTLILISFSLSSPLVFLTLFLQLRTANLKNKPLIYLLWAFIPFSCIFLIAPRPIRRKALDSRIVSFDVLYFLSLFFLSDLISIRFSELWKWSTPRISKTRYGYYVPLIISLI